MPVIHFEAKIEKIGTWIIARVPKSASLKLPSRSPVMVLGTINGFGFQAALEPDGIGSHWLHVDATIQKATKIHVGETVALEIESTKDWPEPAIPPDIHKALAADVQIQDLWASITPMSRWEWIRWIGATNNSETRGRRIEVASSKLRAGMRRPCCFNRSMCCVPEVSKNGVLKQNDPLQT